MTLLMCEVLHHDAAHDHLPRCGTMHLVFPYPDLCPDANGDSHAFHKAACPAACREEALTAELRHLRVLAYASAADRVPPYVPHPLGPLRVRINLSHFNLHVRSVASTVHDVRIIHSSLSINGA